MWYLQEALTPFACVRSFVSNSGARPAIPSGPGIAARVPTKKRVGTSAATFCGSLLRRRPFLLECLPLKASEEAGTFFAAKKGANNMTNALAFINQYMAHAPHMSSYFITLCPALNSVEAKNGSRSTNSQKEKSHAQ